MNSGMEQLYHETLPGYVRTTRSERTSRVRPPSHELPEQGSQTKVRNGPPWQRHSVFVQLFSSPIFSSCIFWHCTTSSLPIAVFFGPVRLSLDLGVHGVHRLAEGGDGQRGLVLRLL